VLLGAVVGEARREAIDRSRLGPLLGHTVRARGYFVKRERSTSAFHRGRFRLELVGDVGSAGEPISEASGVLARGAPRRLDELVEMQLPKRLANPALTIGDEAVIHGELERPVKVHGARFDYASYLRRAGVHAVLRADWVRATGRRRGGPAGVIDHLRRQAEEGVGAGLSPPLAALARGIVLGQDERISSGTASEFKASGLAHLLAVSGQNVTLLAILTLPLLAAAGLGRRTRLVGVLALITIYVPLTGAGPSIMRAGAMGIAGTVASLAGRPASRWYGLLLAAAFTLLIDPRSWLDAGWQLSFAAVLGILLLVPSIRAAFRRWPAPLAEGAAVTLAATLATAPLMAFHFERVSVVSLLANVVALPVVAPIMWLGMLSAAVAQVSIAAATLLNALNGFCLAYLAAIAGWCASLPHAVWSVRLGSPVALVLAYAVPALSIGIGRRVSTRPASPGGRLAGLTGRHRLVFAVAAGAALLIAFWVTGRESPEPPARLTVSFLDIGQGDATLIQAPHGVAVLIDGGPPGGGIVEKLRHAGVRSLDLVVLTHPQQDHEGGLEAVVRHFPVSAFLDGGNGARDRRHDRIVAIARRRGTRFLLPMAGERIALGALELRVLSPKDPDEAPAGDVNDSAIVLVASYRHLDVLLPADAESDVTLGLPLPPVEVLKVAHHGSEDEGLRELLARLRPSIAVIEVGANPYGHPRAEALAALRAVPKVFRTDRDGDVRISLDGPSATVTTRH
jgi:competence protein ComEC